MEMDKSNTGNVVSSERKRLHEAVWPNEPERADLGGLSEFKRLKCNEADPQSKDDQPYSRNSVRSVEGDHGELNQPTQFEPERQLTEGAEPSVNWNAGSKANIRISFGRGSGKTSKNGSHGTNKMRETRAGFEPEEQQAYSNSTPSGRPLPLRQRTSPEPDESIEVSDLRINENTLQVPGKNPQDLGLTSIGLEPQEHANLSPDKSVLKSKDETSRAQPSWVGDLPPKQHDWDVESDGGVILNIEKSGEESGEVSESEVQSSRLQGKLEIPVDANTTKSRATRSESADGDAMMIYSNSNPAANITGHRDLSAANVGTKERAPKLLSDLNPDELKLQLRYFYLTKSPETVDPSNPVRCLVCAHEGHMADACSTLTCAACGKYDQHLTKDCDQVKRCWKCRQRGHLPSDCPSKIRPAHRGPVVCDLCQRTGHAEDDCELLWRTSGRPWESDLRHSSIRLECYECGQSGHLGNDCLSRMPGKRPGTSSWSSNNIEPLSLDSERGITIKGRAKQQKDVVLDESDDDKANFFRPKVPGPVRQGQIHIASQSFNRQPTSWAPSNSAVAKGRRDGGLSNARDQGQYRSRPNDRRSRSPDYSPPDSYGTFSFYQPPLPRGRPPGRAGTNASYQAHYQNRTGESYRPMPSAARDAWIRHRI